MSERFKAYIADYFGDRAIDPDAIRGFSIHLGMKQLKPTSVRRYLSAARPWLAEQRALGRHNVSAESVQILLKSPKCSKGKRPVALKKDAIKDLLTMALSWPDLDMAKFVLLGLTTGARVAEVADIKGEHFDASEGFLAIYGAKTMVHRQVSLRWSSTLKALAVKGLSGPLMDLDHGRGKVRTPKWRALCQAAGIKAVEPRALRRTVASAVAASGKVTTAAYVQWLGHTPSTGIEFYHDADTERVPGDTLEDWLGVPSEFRALLKRCFP